MCVSLFSGIPCVCSAHRDSIHLCVVFFSGLALFNDIPCGGLAYRDSTHLCVASMVQSSPLMGEYTFTQAHPRINGAVFSADGSLLLTMARIPSHKLIPVHNGENTFTQAHPRVNGAVFSADGSLLRT